MFIDYNVGLAIYWLLMKCKREETYVSLRSHAVNWFVSAKPIVVCCPVYNFIHVFMIRKYKCDVIIFDD